MPTITKLYSMEEAAEHNTKEDCWIVIDGKVYDVSTYLDEHPGGDDVLLEVTGKDATEEFEDAGHSNDARVLMEEYCIGELDSIPVPAPKIMSKEELDNFPLKVLNLSKHYWYVPVAAIGLSLAVGIFLRRRN